MARERQLPAVLQPLQCGPFGLGQVGEQPFFALHPLPEDGVADRRLELDQADPARAQGLRRTVMANQRLLEVTPHAARQMVVAVGGAHPRRSQHAAQPGRPLYQQRAAAQACALYGGANAARAAPHHQHVVGLDVGRSGVGGQSQEQ